MSNSNMAITAYLNDLRELDMLPWDELEALAVRGLDGDRRAFNRVVESLLPLVLKIVKDFKWLTFEDREELIQTGNTTLIQVLRTWKPDGGAALSSWVWRSVKRDMGRALTGERRFRDIHKGLIESNGLDNTDDDAQVGAGHFHGGLDHYDMADETAESDPARVAEHLFMQNAKSEVLSDRESEVIQMLYERGFTLESIAEYQGVSKQAINKVHQRALRKLRVYLQV